MCPLTLPLERGRGGIERKYLPLHFPSDPHATVDARSIRLLSGLLPIHPAINATKRGHDSDRADETAANPGFPVGRMKGLNPEPNQDLAAEIEYCQPTQS
jgi:hypothetical protein